MKLTFNTMIADVSVALGAINSYHAGRFDDAINHLHSILDLEPNNWDARLMLAACYYRTRQWAASHRVFELIANRTDSAAIRQKALEGLQVTTAKLNKWNGSNTSIPEEFGCYVERTNRSADEAMSWL